MMKDNGQFGDMTRSKSNVKKRGAAGSLNSLLNNSNQLLTGITNDSNESTFCLQIFSTAYSFNLAAYLARLQTCTVLTLPSSIQ